jgi:hypothetical protein
LRLPEAAGVASTLIKWTASGICHTVRPPPRGHSCSRSVALRLSTSHGRGVGLEQAEVRRELAERGPLNLPPRCLSVFSIVRPWFESLKPSPYLQQTRSEHNSTETQPQKLKPVPGIRVFAFDFFEHAARDIRWWCWITEPSFELDAHGNFSGHRTPVMGEHVDDVLQV